MAQDTIWTRWRLPYGIPLAHFRAYQRFERNDGRCALCGERIEPGRSGATEVDHRIPRSRGGRSDAANLQVVHWDCNRAKGDLMPDDPRVAMRIAIVRAKRAPIEIRLFLTESFDGR